MLTSGKLVLIAALLYATTIVLPALFGEVERVAPAYAYAAAVASLVFIAGMVVGALLVPMRSVHLGKAPVEEVRTALKVMTAMLAVVTIYVFAWGPRSPIFEAFSGADSAAVALMREDAIKYNRDLVFVRIYTWARDFFAPVVVVLSLLLWVGVRRFKGTGIALLGLTLAVAVGLWSGQKATIVYYLLAAVIVLSKNVLDLGWRLLKFLPVALLIIVLTFAVTQPDLFTPQQASVDEPTLRLMEGVVHRILVSPVELAGLYIYATDVLQVIRPSEVIPIIGSRPAEFGSIENRLSYEYWGDDGTASGHANGPAFAYAYVLGGLAGCFLGGAFTMVVLGAIVRMVRRSGSVAAALIFEAYLSYLLLDLLSSNFLGYLLNAVMATVLLTGVAWLVLPIVRSRGSTQSSP